MPALAVRSATRMPRPNFLLAHIRSGFSIRLKLVRGPLVCFLQRFDDRIPLYPEMKFFLFILGGFGVMALTYLLMTFYMRHKDGIQPSYTGLLIMATSMVCVLAGFYALQRFGIDVHHGQPRDFFWLLLGILWLVLSVWTVYQRQTSGTVLMDLGAAPMFRIQIVFAVFMAALAIGFAVNPESRA